MVASRALVLFGWAAAAVALPSQGRGYGENPPCRFASLHSQEEIARNPESFLHDYLYWEGKFHQNDISYNSANGMSYDGTQLDWETGIATKKHNFSAASKESLQIMIYAQAIAGSKDAARFLSPDQPDAAVDIAAGIMATKLQTYLKFNETYPGFGGFLPWIDSASQEITPSADWVDRVPALDNGELIWAVYGAIEAMESCGHKDLKKLAAGWSEWLDYTKQTAAKIFYTGQGRVCAVTAMADQALTVTSPYQTYACETNSTLDDPYEGELFTWWLHFFSDLPQEDQDALWEAKRAKLVSVEYEMDGLGPITVQEGYWFSSHEQWKVLEMPYYDVDIVRRVFTNAERVRTCNSVVTKNPGLFASINNITNITSDEIIGYISNTGIPSISSQTEQENDVITPYGSYPTILINKGVGLAWVWNMLTAKKMQNPYGSTEATRIDGTGVSALLTWDSKVTTVAAVLGGVQDLVRTRLQREGLYEDFISITEREHSRVFTELKGEDVELCLPKAKVPDTGLEDFTSCTA